MQKQIQSIGLMSGTSMDGIDAALLTTDGRYAVSSAGLYSLSYERPFRLLLKAAEYTVHHCHGDLIMAKKIYPAKLRDYLQQDLGVSDAVLSTVLQELTAYLIVAGHDLSFDAVVRVSTELHAKAVQELLQLTGVSAQDVRVIGYHGQTLFHRPEKRISIQVGDAEWLAKKTGISVVYDFRGQDMQLGGQGAPLAPLYHQALVMRDQRFPAVVVNCGGIANVTLLTHDEIIGFDTGPGNALLDRYVTHHTNGEKSMDENGYYGLRGVVHETILQQLIEQICHQNGKNFFSLKPPKSLDVRDLQFDRVTHLLAKLSMPDASATLAALTAETIVRGASLVSEKIHQQQQTNWILAGGGWKNPTIYRELKKRVLAQYALAEIGTADECGWNNQAIEAELFAYLAVRSLQGLPISLPTTTGVAVPATGGKLLLHSS